jgi:uncharacterized protein YutE (UPF0331/DUF86 family)
VTPGTIDLKVVGDRLGLVSGCLDELRSLPQASVEEFLADRRNPLAADTLLRRALEALFDIARHLLSRTHGIGALEYREVARQAVEREFVQDAELGRRFMLMAGFRNRLIHHYDEVTPRELYEVITGSLSDLERLAEALREAAARLAHRDQRQT